MTIKVHPKYRFPWRGGNHFELLIDSERFYPAMRAAIKRATRYVLLEIYLFESGRVADGFIEALAGAARRGVAVRLLLDDFGARRLSRRDRRRLADAGAELAFYNPLHLNHLFQYVLRDHRKLLIVDGEAAFVGGAGITDDFASAGRPARSWRETMVRIAGPVLADWHALFATIWERHAAAPSIPPAPAPAPRPDGMLGRVTSSRRGGRQEITRSLLKRIRGAQRRAWIATAYFIPSWKLRRALRDAASRGVEVRVLLPGPQTDHPAVRHAGRRYYGRLLRHGVRIFEYQPRFLHNKVILCDDWVSIGSSNLDRWNLRWNLEANQEVNDPRFAEAVRAMIEDDLSRSLECEYGAWMTRPWHVRLAERVWGAVDLWLARLGMGAKRR